MNSRHAGGGSARPELPLAVVVGAGGMGMAIARRLGQRNRLLIADKDPERLERAEQAIREEGYDGRGMVCDILDPAAVARFAEQVAAHGPLRILAHVTALSPSMADWQAIMRLNLVGARLVHDAMLPLAVETTAAIFISSLASIVPPAPTAETVAIMDDPLAPDFLARLLQSEGGQISSGRAYSLSKRALNRMCRKQASAWALRGARIVSLSPGAIDTPMGAFENANNPAKKEHVQRIPLRREGTMPEIADAVEFLTSERASYITGADLLIDGGSSSLFD
jgi:NAD(P)-dependent dehydrogenase (short-subunit alcohol dehydrogenase family)